MKNAAAAIDFSEVFMSKTNYSHYFLISAPIPKLMKKYSLPCIIRLLVGGLYTIVDQIFIANATYLGSYGNAANTVVFPLTVIALAISVMIGDGACAYVSNMLGAGNEEKAHTAVGNSIILTIAASIVLTAVYFTLLEPIVRFFGGGVNQETFALSKEYFFWIAAGLPFYMFGQAMNPIIRSDGNPRFAMISTLAGAVTNIILDPIFIFALKWGMKGAAIATVIGQIVTCVLAVWYLCHLRLIKLQKSSFVLKKEVWMRVVSLGGCSFLSQISLVAAMAAINNMIRKYGAMDAIFCKPALSQIPMAVVGIVMKFFQIVISVCVGMAAGCIPIASYNLGAERKDRAKTLFKYLLICEAAVGAAALFFAEAMPGQIIKIFGSANESPYYTSFALKAFRIYLCMMILACVNKATFIYLQALGEAFLSTALSVVREVIFGVGFALLLPRFFGLDGVLYSMPVSDFLTFLLSSVCILHVRNKLRG